MTYDRYLYRERYFGRIKPYRRVATRYDKKAANVPGFVWVASIAIMLAKLSRTDPASNGTS